ncbi:TPA: FtsW/RodA/SpoVE family cell cycle protein [Enterococcus faecium]|uniref:Probable peptidoglycan glycosyltransferase FtsW n=1 Tax=Enterococcus faecium TaxID=1352 RepID=A0AB74CSM3_ENTFC|nr:MULTISPECIES: FtsW/RodA/SpoVE family cell cycle protein [Enterococcus]EGP4987756.1 FtsW/RodA/SpoVE family cell cycle protein [Enterococcus faecium]EGP5257578.1 FtsW/RodA/SpoVE family cell cycle protein [Enterococcus faecium]EME7080805.1 FtsW/RodA/SpoVE family cell cycle protein [Enterococcus faecium]EME7142472.1 FtsW/RodA/SpoVE family cell cycle protein [Enterococcus faecium]EMF0335974.1 FtsW/RodA/SpoVE family cell cycle protein [Enterococcus faecium]
MKKRKKIDWWILGPYLTLSMIGLLEVYSASSYRLLQADENTKSLLLRQLIFIFLSWGVIFLARSIKLHYLLHPKIAGYGLALSIFFLILVRVGIFGVTVNGAQRWISLFGIQFQPSELANLFLIFYLSCFFRDGNNPPKDLKKPFLITVGITLLILFQPKIAGALMILSIAWVIFWAAAVPFKKGIYLIVTFSALLIGAAGGVLYLGNKGWLPQMFNHAYERIATLRDPFIDSHGAGYQMTHSFYALYNGGIWGRGLGNSITKKGYLPETETDFIFSIITEELGLIGALCVLFLLFSLCMRIFCLSSRCKNQQAGLFLLGFGTLLFVQTIMNVGSIAGLMPMTGVPLPFVSYGGTSYLILSLGIGITLNISSKIQAEELPLYRPEKQ